ISDGWSLAVLMRETSALYNSLSSCTAHELSTSLPALPIQYADFAVWQRNWLDGDLLNHQLLFWSDLLAEAPQALDLPSDFPRSSSASQAGSQLPLFFASTLLSALLSLSFNHQATLFMTLLASFYCLLSRYSHQRDICVGSPIAGRTRTETEPLIGF